MVNIIVTAVHINNMANVGNFYRQSYNDIIVYTQCLCH